MKRHHERFERKPTSNGIITNNGTNQSATTAVIRLITAVVGNNTVLGLLENIPSGLILINYGLITYIHTYVWTSIYVYVYVCMYVYT